jgi:hypothetical protein
MTHTEEMPVPLSGLDLAHVRAQLVNHFNLDELQTLCFDLGIHYDNLSGDTLNAKARELLKYCYRYDLLQKLIQHCQRMHAGVQWVKSIDSDDVNLLPEAMDDPLQRIYALVKAFNRNRQHPYSEARTAQGDEIAYQMREVAPMLFGKIEVGDWLKGDNIGKRLFAIKYLDWLQDIDFVDDLISRLGSERPFVQLHILITLYGMIDQLDAGSRFKLKTRMLSFNIVRNDPNLTFWKQRIIDSLKQADDLG